MASSVGRQIIDLGSVEQQREGAYDIVHACIGLRSPATLVKRANSLLSFLRWSARNHVGLTNPFIEQVVWEHFQ